jgi:hypothetical protein
MFQGKTLRCSMADQCINPILPFLFITSAITKKSLTAYGMRLAKKETVMMPLDKYPWSKNMDG